MDMKQCWFKRERHSPTAKYEEGQIHEFLTPAVDNQTTVAVIAAKSDGFLVSIPISQVCVASENPDITKEKADKAAADKTAAEKSKSAADLAKAQAARDAAEKAHEEKEAKEAADPATAAQRQVRAQAFGHV